MSNTDFDAFVKRQQVEDEKKDGFDPEKQLREWLDYLNALYEQIKGYLKAYVESGTAKIALRDIQLNEEFSGVYTASELILTIGRSTVTFTPIGTMLIGSKGRVDVQGPLGKARLALVNKAVTNARQLIQITARFVGDPPPSPPPKQAIKHIEWTWKISIPPPEMEFVELTQDAFFNMILTVANG
jgi:hypothetical protein